MTTVAMNGSGVVITGGGKQQQQVSAGGAGGGGEGGDEANRGAWGSPVEFVLTCIGCAVGLGNVWRFPYLVYKHGGGAFLIPYLLMLVLVGMPIFMLEVSFGQFSSLGPVTTWKAGIGMCMCIVCWYINIYYQVIIAWCFYYMYASMNTVLPWSTCNNWWNTKYCVTPGANLSSLPFDTTNVTLKSSSEEYFYNNVLQLSDGIHNMGAVQGGLAMCLLQGWVIIFFVMIKGASSLGKVSYFTSLFPYVLLTIMVGFGCSLEGAGTGIEFYLKPDLSKLANTEAWTDAANQVFYSMSIAMGSLIAMSSFNNFHNNIVRDAFIVPFADAFTSLYAGFAVFSMLGYMATAKGVSVNEVVDQGPGLIFIVYPEGLATMPAAQLWSILFYFMLCLLGFSTQFSAAEGVCTAIMDEFPQILRVGQRPTILRAVYCITSFLLALPMVTEGGFYLFDLVDNYGGGLPLIYGGLFEMLVIVYVYGVGRFMEDIALMLGHRPFTYWQICWMTISPLLLALVLLISLIFHEPLTLGDYVYPPWANAIGWATVIFPFLVIVSYFMYLYCKEGGYQVLKRLAKPSKDWGPALKENRTGRYALADIEQQMVESESEKQIQMRHKQHAQRRYSSSAASTVTAVSSMPVYNGNGGVTLTLNNGNGRHNHAYDQDDYQNTQL